MLDRVAYFVSPHGFGHAARSAAVVNALLVHRPRLVTHLFTTVPHWFWEDSLDGAFELHPFQSDIGLIQVSPIQEDPRATFEALDRLRPFENAVRRPSRRLEELACELVICDVSPLGIAAARTAGLPSVLVESFTWDWIYQAYFDAEPRLRPVAAEMAALYAQVDLRIQAEPVCLPLPSAESVGPVYRKVRSDAETIRKTLGLDARPLVLITMGGTSWKFESLERLSSASDYQFVAFAGAPNSPNAPRAPGAPGAFGALGARSAPAKVANLHRLPDRSPVFLPDLVAAADVVVGKLGYSTVAEAWAAGTRYVYVPRADFPEGPSLSRFAHDNLPCREISLASLQNGDWLGVLPELMAEPRPEPRTLNGAEQVAELILASARS